MKRFFDLISSLLAIVIFIIPMIFIALVIKADSKGPILFTQKRVGKDGKLFNIYKFRTMKIDTPNVSTEDLGNPAAYITVVGKLLRKTSMDELPQLFNILKGDMSIVGPRPALYNQYNLIAMRDELGISSIRPGLTGYAQVMGRDLITDEKKVEYDYIYLKNSNIFFDLKIIWFTVFSVIKAEGVRLK